MDNQSIDDYGFIEQPLRSMVNYKPYVVYPQGQESDPANRAFLKRFAQFNFNYFTKNGRTKCELCQNIPNGWRDSNEAELIECLMGEKRSKIVVIQLECPAFEGIIFTNSDGSGVGVGKRWHYNKKQTCICAYDAPDDFMQMMIMCLLGQDDGPQPEN